MPNLGDRHVQRSLQGGDEYVRHVQMCMRAVLNAAVQESVEVLILGAFGCGAFKNDPKVVAKLFREVLNSKEFEGAFSSVCFAIFERQSNPSTSNLTVFRQVLQFGEVANVTRSFGTDSAGPKRDRAMGSAHASGAPKKHPREDEHATPFEMDSAGTKGIVRWVVFVLPKHPRSTRARTGTLLPSTR